MKPLFIFIGCFLLSNTFSQENPTKEISTEVNNVTVFIKGAQVVRKKTVEIPQGRTTLKFTNLSPFIDPKSIQMKVKGDVTVLSVNHQQNYQREIQKSEELMALESKLEVLNEKIIVENTYLTIISQELSFLESNKTLGCKSQELTLSNLKDATTFYNQQLTSLKLGEIDRKNRIKELTKEINILQQQINKLTTIIEYPSGEVLVKFDTKNTTTAKIELSYFVENAGWFPSYDIRAKSIDEAIELVYKANVHQDTKENWNNVMLKFSSSDPNVTGVAPVLKTYFLNYNILPPKYTMTSNQVRGTVRDDKNQPLPGVTVVVRGTTIGSVTDLNGNYSITLPNNADRIVYSYMGFLTQELPVNSSVMNVQLEEDMALLDEVVVVGYGVQKKSDLTGAISGMASGVSVSPGQEIKLRGVNSIPLPMARIENQVTVEFQLDIPFTINSDNKNYTIEMVSYLLPAYYEYYCIPKIDRSAFLMAYITDWEKYNLMEGEANLFFENTYIGKSLLDIRNTDDTLSLSLGRDKNVVVSREKQKELMSKRFLGNSKEVTKSWLITVKNNKSQKVFIDIRDQIPVSTAEEIVVEVQKLSGGILTDETGEVSWKLLLDPGENKKIELQYAVKYPKSKNLLVE